MMVSEIWSEDTLDGLGKYSRVWLHSKDGTWRLATVRSMDEDNCSVALDTALGEGTGETIAVNKQNLVPANPSMLSGVSDLTRLSFLNNPSILHNLRERHASDLIYTHAGPVLIAVNPFQRVDLYTAEQVSHYVGRPSSGTASQGYEPHIFLTADVAFKQMVDTGKSQSILITGESGAGKTETTKFVMKYLAGLAGGTGMEDRILETNPILEAFGNAKTLHNNNSSRFGKLIEIYFNEFHSITGALIKTYLLEKSRVVHQLPNERSYHIFYQLCRGASAEERALASLPEHVEDFDYLRGSGCSEIDGVDDAAAFEEVKIALNDIGINSDQQHAIWRVLSAVLWLGNIKFSQSGSSDAAHIKDGDSMRALCTAASLLGCHPDHLEASLVRRRMVAGGELINRELSVESSIENRDALAKAIYQALFRWLVRQINVALSTNMTESATSLSILDIYGFECFKENSFEQLCINYANERLQAQFAAHMFELEQAAYEEEGVDWARVKFEDNQECVELIEARPPMKPGILSLLDEECMFPKGSDTSFVEKLRRTHAQHARFRRDSKTVDTTFTLNHFAGPVTYSADKFLDKNRDALSPDLVGVLSESHNPLVVQLTSEISDGTNGERSRGQLTVGARFRDQLRDLINCLDQTHLHFVRCIKPNSLQQPFHFDAKLVLHQLRCCGILEVARIARAGFPTRYVHSDFAERYRLLLPGMEPGPLPQGMQPIDVCRDLVNHFKISDDMYQIGISRIFFRAGVLGQLEDHAARAARACLTMQSGWRMAVQRRSFVDSKKSCFIIQSHWRGRQARVAYLRLRACHAAATVLQAAIRTYMAQQRYRQQRNAACAIQMGWRRTQLERRIARRVEVANQARESAAAEATRIAAEERLERQRCQDDYEALLTEFGVDLSEVRDILTVWKMHEREIEDFLSNRTTVQTRDSTQEETIHRWQAQCAELQRRVDEYKDLESRASKLEIEVEELRDENAMLMESQTSALTSQEHEKAKRTSSVISVVAAAGPAPIAGHDARSYVSEDTVSIMSYEDREVAEDKVAESSFMRSIDAATTSPIASPIANDHERMAASFGRAGPAGAVAGLTAEFDKKTALFDDDASFILEVNEGISMAYGMDPHSEFHNLMARYKRWRKDFQVRLKMTNESLKRVHVGTLESSHSDDHCVSQSSSRQSEGSLTSRLVKLARGNRRKSGLTSAV